MTPLFQRNLLIHLLPAIQAECRISDLKESDFLKPSENRCWYS